MISLEEHYDSDIHQATWGESRTDQILESKICQVSRLDVEILEGFGLAVDDLVNELSLDFVSRRGFPPYGLVEQFGDRLQYPLWNVHMSPALEDLTIGKLGDFGH